MKFKRDLKQHINSSEQSMVSELIVNHCKTWNVKELKIHEDKISFRMPYLNFKANWEPYALIEKGEYKIISDKNKTSIIYKFYFLRHFIMPIVILIPILIGLILFGIDYGFIKMMLYLIPAGLIMGFLITFISNGVMFKNLIQEINDSLIDL